ncbi:hypothetical protein QQP08_016769 [Theobroma cacao]|nr:hypothetical protein QQP08_016769 [Theobroma cacao]
MACDGKSSTPAWLGFVNTELMRSSMISNSSILILSNLFFSGQGMDSETTESILEMSMDTDELLTMDTRHEVAK